MTRRSRRRLMEILSAGCRSRSWCRPTICSTRADDRATADFALGHAQPAARAHGDGPERRLRAAVAAAQTCSSSASASRDGHGLPRAGAVQRLFRRGRRRPPTCRPTWRRRRRWNRAPFRPSSTTRRRGPNWASRFHLDGNPQPELDWPVQRFTYEDASHQRVSEDLAFTFVDFVACDPRYAGALRAACRAKSGTRAMLPGRRVLLRDASAAAASGSRACAWSTATTACTRAIVDERLMREARRCREMWHSLQELGGIHNSHAERLLAREQRCVGSVAAAAAAALGRDACGAQPRSAAAPVPLRAAAAAGAEAAAHSRDEAYIETARCSTATSARRSTTKMFAYDETSRPTSPTPTRAPTRSSWKRPRAARCRSSIRASRATRTSPDSPNC